MFYAIIIRKIGKLVSDIAEKSMSSLGLDVNDNTSNPQELMSKLFANPQDLINVFASAKDAIIIIKKCPKIS